MGLVCSPVLRPLRAVKTGEFTRSYSSLDYEQGENVTCPLPKTKKVEVGQGVLVVKGLLRVCGDSSQTVAG